MKHGGTTSDRAANDRRARSTSRTCATAYFNLLLVIKYATG